MGRGRRRRVRGHRLLRVLRPGGPTARPRRHRPVAAGRAQPPHLPGAGRGRGDRAVELPAGHPDRDGDRRARRGQRGLPQAGRADTGHRPVPGRGAGGRRPAAGRAVVPPRRGRGGRRPPGRAPRRLGHRLHRLPSGRPGDPPRRGCRRRGSTPDQAGHHRARRQEPDHRRRRRRPGRGRAGHRRQRVRLRRPEVLGRVTPHRAPCRLRADRPAAGRAHRAHGAGPPAGLGGHHRPGDRCGRTRAAVADATSRRRPVPGPLVAGRGARGWLVRRADDRRRGARVRSAGHRRALRPRPRRRPGRLHRRRVRHGQRHRLRARPPASTAGHR